MRMFREYKICQIGEVVGGGTPSTDNEEFWDGNIPWITPKDLTGYSSVYISHGENYITRAGMNKSGTKMLPAKTVLFSSRAPIGYVAIAQNPICTNQGFKSIICDEKIIDPLYFYYYIKSNLEYFKQWGSGATFPEISGNAMKRIKVNIINDIDSQRKIAKTLYCYDNLIEVNNKRIKVLEQMAENLYKEWFVRFRFPGHETAEFENGIPKGWEISKISDIATIKAGGDKPDAFSDAPTEECPIPIFSNGLDKDGLYGYTNKAVIENESVTISARGTVGFVCLRRKPYVPIVRLVAVIPKTQTVTPLYLYYYLRRDSVIANGTSQQQITVPMVSRKRMIIPPASLLQAFDKREYPIWNLTEQLKAQNESLIQQRDLLLTRLMSGKLEV